MCGIVGIFLDAQSTDPRRLAAIEAMAATLRHRGPDDEGIWTDSDAGIALGHRRFAIVDLSDAGHQPMMSHGQRLMMTFNGEIYNFAAMRRPRSSPRTPALKEPVMLAAVSAPRQRSQHANA